MICVSLLFILFLQVSRNLSIFILIIIKVAYSRLLLKEKFFLNTNFHVFLSSIFNHKIV